MSCLSAVLASKSGNRDLSSFRARLKNELIPRQVRTGYGVPVMNRTVFVGEKIIIGSLQQIAGLVVSIVARDGKPGSGMCIGDSLSLA